jgi:hypothetical protein
VAGAAYFDAGLRLAGGGPEELVSRPKRSESNNRDLQPRLTDDRGGFRVLR